TATEQDDMNADIIMVHDGARPIVTPQIIAELSEACMQHVGAIPAITINDSLRHLTPDGMSVPVNRSEYRAVQTPQAFRSNILRKAYQQPYQPSFTDDASVVAAAGYTDVVLTNGDSRNIKITLPGDIEIVDIYMRTLQ
ncbi:MAG: 2-C-methyl-D-erythritol 4-phosphate cytidylyltransferase, partial [Muribaculaceae bacterium]|nr:2-C-methyl-D-erythritol 4-phosphate cytidylyltransferase [Muribaculaceae bacterium]